MHTIKKKKNQPDYYSIADRSPLSSPRTKTLPLPAYLLTGRGLPPVGK